MTAPTDSAALRAAFDAGWEARNTGYEGMQYGYAKAWEAFCAARLAAAAIPPEQDGYAEGRAREGCVGTMNPERATYFLERFKREEKLLGPHEQWALDYTIAMLATDRHAEGWIAGLEEAAKIAEDKRPTPETLGLDALYGYERARFEISTAIRTIANGGAAA